ncbi:M23 family metallopeptidase [Zhenpiania hominis]|uniref:M23 family metallopeptidase n=1 Tax=Zhenpiania hominis TaxID=2763644 RepID=UPI0039F45C33
MLACESGTVISVGWNGGFGNCIIIDHGNGIQTLYGHLSKIHVKKRKKVARGQFIGEVGSTGNSTGPHLHLGVKINGCYVNPEKGYLNI